MEINTEVSFKQQAAAQNNSDYWSQLSTKLQQPSIQPASDAQPWSPANNAQPWRPASPVLPSEVQQQPQRAVEMQSLPTTQADPIALLHNAESALATQGMQPDTKVLYQNAITAADQLYTPADRSAVAALSNVLSSGKKEDGTPISDAERFQAHNIINSELKIASLGIQMRLSYADQLMGARQFATAERVLKDAVTAADTLPQDVISQESKQLKKDMTNPNLSREQQIALGNYLKDIPGDKSLQQPGFQYLPVLTRLELADFYVSAGARDANGNVTGVVKPELALSTLSGARAILESSAYGANGAKADSDPLYAAELQKANLMLPENLKKSKSNADGIWSNPLVDLASGAAVVGVGTMVLGALFRSPQMVKLGLATVEGTATVGGKALAGGLMLGGSTVLRHYGKEALTGDSESWTQSTIHGAAGLAEIGLLVAGRAKLSPLMYRGANTETALLRIAETKGTDGILNAGTLKNLYSANRWTVPSELAATDAATVIVKDGALVNPINLGLDAAKSATLTKSALAAEPVKGYFARKAKFITGLPSATVENLKGAVNFKPLDLMTATKQDLAWRGNWTGYLAALGGVEGYQAISSLDRKYDVINGGQISYADSFKNNMLTVEPLKDALFMMPFLRAGVMPSNFYSEGAGAIRRAVSSTRGVIRAAGPIATSENPLTQGVYTALPAAIATSSFWENLQYKKTSNLTKDLLQQEGH